MSDRAVILAHIRSVVRRPGSTISGQTVGYLLADFDLLLAAARGVVLANDGVDSDWQAESWAKLRALVEELTP